MFKFRIHHNRGVGAMACHTSKFFLTHITSLNFFQGVLNMLETLFNDPILCNLFVLADLFWYSLIYQQNKLRQYRTIERFFVFFSEFLKMNEKIDEGLKETPSTCYLQSCVLPRVKQCVYSNRMVFRLRHEFI